MKILNLLDQARRLVGPRGPRSSLQFQGQFGYSINGAEYVWGKNRIVSEGIDYILNAALRGQGVLSTFYVVPFAANVTPAANLTAATFNSTVTEFTNYTQATRPVWTPDAASTAQLLENSAAPALYTIGTGVQTAIYGAGLISVSTKGSGSGVLVAAAKAPAPFTGLAEAFDVRVKYRLTGSST